MACKKQYIRDVIKDQSEVDRLEEIHAKIGEEAKESKLFREEDGKLVLLKNKTKEGFSFIGKINEQYGKIIAKLPKIGNFRHKLSVNVLPLSKTGEQGSIFNPFALFNTLLTQEKPIKLNESEYRELYTSSNESKLTNDGRSEELLLNITYGKGAESSNKFGQNVLGEAQEVSSRMAGMEPISKSIPNKTFPVLADLWDRYANGEEINPIQFSESIVNRILARGGFIGGLQEALVKRGLETNISITQEANKPNVYVENKVLVINITKDFIEKELINAANKSKLGTLIEIALSEEYLHLIQQNTISFEEMDKIWNELSKENQEELQKLYHGVDDLKDINEDFKLSKEGYVLELLRMKTQQILYGKTSENVKISLLDESITLINFLKDLFNKIIDIFKNKPKDSVTNFILQRQLDFIEGKETQLVDEDFNIISPFGKIQEQENAIIDELKSADKDKIVTTVNEFFSSTKSRLQKLINNKNYEVLAKLLTTKEGINKYTSVKNILDDAKKALDDVEGIARKVRSIAITIVETDKMTDLIRENVKNIVSDKDNAYKNISTLQYYLYTLRDWELLLNDAKATFEGNPITEAQIDTTLGKIKAIEKDILTNDIAGMVSAFKPFLTPISKAYLKPFKQEIERIQNLHDKSTSKTDRENYAKQLKALNQKIKDYDLATEENVMAFLKGERGDAGFANSLLEAYSDSTDPTVASFAEWLKGHLREVAVQTNAMEREYEKEIAPFDKILGSRFNPETLGKQLTEEVVRVDNEGNEFTVAELLNPFAGTETVKIDGNDVTGGYRKIDQLFNNKIKALEELIRNGENIEENKKALLKQRKDYALFKREFMNQEFTDNFYQKYDLWNDEIGQELKEDVEEIFSKIRDIQIPLTLGKELSEEEYAEIDALFDDYILLGSVYNADGTPKTGIELKKAEKMKEIREFNRELFTYIENAQAFEKAKTKHSESLLSKGLSETSKEYIEAMEKWEIENTRDVISQDFYKIRKGLTEEAQEIQEDLGIDRTLELDGVGSFMSNWNIINDGVYGHRDEDGQPMGTEIKEQATEDIKKATENLEEIKKRIASTQNLSKKEFDRLSELSERNFYLHDLSTSELQELDELKKKRDVKKNLPEEEKKEIERKYNRLNIIFNKLKELQSKVPTKYYVQAFNNLSQKYGVTIDEMGEINGDPFSDSYKLDKLLKHADFKKWFEANHIEVEKWNAEHKIYEKQWIRLHQWNRIKPNNPKHIERKPARKYSTRVVKDEYRTGYNPTTKQVELKVGRQIDNKGYWLPKQGRFNSKKYQDLKNSQDERGKALFGLLKVHTKYLLQAQENIPNKNKLWMDIPRLLKEITERRLKFLEKLKEKPSDIPSLLWNEIKAKLSAITDFSQGEGKFEAVFADKYGNEFTSVPIKYTGKLVPEDVSLNLYRSISKYYFSAKLNQKLIEISPIANSLQRILGEPAYKPLDLLKRVVGKGTSPKGKSNIRAQAVENIVQRIFEGQEKKMELGEKFEKIAALLKGLTVIKTIAYDIPASIANVLNAEKESFINASNGYITHKNLGKAHSLFFSQYFPAFFNDYKLNKLGVQSLQSQIFDTFEFVQSHTYEDKVGEKFSQSKIKDALALNWLKNHREWGELFVQSVNALAYLDATLIEQEQPDGSIKSIPISQAYELDSNGVIQLKEGIDPKWSPNGKATNELKSKIARHNALVNGNYAKGVDKPEAETYTLFSLVFLMKRFFVYMFLNRFAGTNVSLSKYGLRADPRFNIKTGNFKGHFIETLSVASKQLENKLKTGEIYKMSDEEKQALMKTVYDGAFMLLAWFLYRIVFGFDPDDEDKYKKLREKSWVEAQGLYQSARLLTESSTFINPYQYKDFIFDSPMIGKTITDYLELIRFTIGNLTNDDDSYYKRDEGIYEKGESKAKARAFKVTGLEKVLKGTGDENTQVSDYFKIRGK